VYIILQVTTQQGSVKDQNTANDAASTQQHSVQHHPTSQNASLKTPANKKNPGVGI